MAIWRAKCWLGSSVGYQELEVKANTVTGAIEQFKRVYGATQVLSPRVVNNSSTSSSGDVSGSLYLILILFVFWLLIEYWWIVVPLLVIGGILYYFGKDE